MKEVATIPLELVRVAIGEWPARLKDCVNARGEHFEQFFFTFILSAKFVTNIYNRIFVS